MAVLCPSHRGDARHAAVARPLLALPLARAARLALLVLAMLVVSDVTLIRAQTFQCSSNPGMAVAKPKYANRFFRHLSSIFNMSSGEAGLQMERNWAEDPRLKTVVAPRAEGKCKSSWAITAVSATEMAYALVAASTPSMGPPVPISLQQVLDCEPSSSSCSRGGWPTSALDYMVDSTNQWGGLAAESAYPYAQKAGKCSRPKVKDATTTGVTGYDQVDFYGWFGLMLAVNIQPAIAFVRGSYPTFQAYTGKLYFDTACAAAGVVDHSILVMGYSITGQGAYWILRNSWGVKWGIQGHMAMGMAGGTGICGIHSVPAIYPIIKTPYPCQSHQNPCGGGVCTDTGGGSYQCLCLEPLFIVGTDRGGAQTCVYADACSLENENPCAVGTCINDAVGGFFCLCPPGFKQGLRPKGTSTCVPTLDTPDTLSFPAPVDCPLVYQLFGLNEEQFLAQNPQLGMDYCDIIPANTQVLVIPPMMGSVHCGLFYSWKGGDSCESVADSFGLTVDQLVALNPGINCTDSTADTAPCENQQMCVSQGNGADLPMCTEWYTVQSGDTCDSIMADHSLNATSFFSLNPGVACDSLFPSLGGGDGSGDDGGGAFGIDTSWSGGVQVCVDAYLVDAPGPFASPRSLRELPSTQPSLRSSPSSLLSANPSSHPTFFTRGRRLGMGFTVHYSPYTHTQSLIQASAIPPPLSSLGLSLRGRRLAKAKAKCKANYSVVRGDFCARVIALKFQNSARKLADLNNGYVCNNDRLYVGLTLCTKR